MSRDRGSRHAAMVLACVALMTVSLGCHSPFQRLADGKAPTRPRPSHRPRFPNCSRPREPPSTHARADGPRVSASHRIHDRAGGAARRYLMLHSSMRKRWSRPAARQTRPARWRPFKPRERDKKPAKTAVPVPATAPAAASRPGSGDVAAAPPLRPQVVEWLASEAAKPANQALFRRAVNTIAEAAKNSAKDDPTRSTDIRTATLALEDRLPLAVSDLRLCRKVNGFGSFEPLPSSAVSAGSPC